MYQLEISELEKRCLQRALVRTHKEDSKSDNDEAKRALNLEQMLIGKLENLKTE